MSVRWFAESFTRLTCVMNTTFRERIYSRWCCIDRWRRHDYSGVIVSVDSNSLATSGVSGQPSVSSALYFNLGAWVETGKAAASRRTPKKADPGCWHESRCYMEEKQVWRLKGVTRARFFQEMLATSASYRERDG